MGPLPLTHGGDELLHPRPGLPGAGVLRRTLTLVPELVAWIVLTVMFMVGVDLLLDWWQDRRSGR